MGGESDLNYRRQYEQKLVSAEEAVKDVRSGEQVQFNSYNGIPTTLDKALAARKDELKEVIIHTSVTIYPLHTISADPSGEHFILHSWHISGYDRKLAQTSLGVYYVPALYYEHPLIFERHRDMDWVMIQTAPMDENGNFNFGPSACHAKAIIDAGKKIVLEVNENMPVVYGGCNESVHIDEVDLVVEGENPALFTIPEKPPTEIDRRVAALIMEEIEDGACLQLGIGAMPNAVGEMIANSDLKDLGVHTEMLVDAIVRMSAAGRVTGANKAVDKGKIAFGFAIGSQFLYDFVDRNPDCITYSVDYMNMPHNIARNPKVVAINSAIEVDLFSQINSESVGTRQISGTGGQVDFLLGAYMSKGGKGIICMTSTYRGPQGQLISRIRPTLSPGTIVTVPRTIANYIATEYGIANVKGKSTWQRAEALVEIAHPDFRDDLIKEAEKMKLWRKTNKIAD